MLAQAMPVFFRVDPSPVLLSWLHFWGEGFWSFTSASVHGAGLFWRRLWLANRSDLMASIYCRSSKSLLRSSCFSQPATTTASRRRTSSWTGSTAWSGSVRLRGECDRGLRPCWCMGRSHHWSPPANEQQLPHAPVSALPLHSHGSMETSNPHLSPPSYGLSCEIEPLSESASNTLKAKKNTGIIKRWSE